jgi:aminoglycoside 6'-N-acetyltransferase I
VDSDLRKTGVGRALIAAAERHAIDAGHQEIASDCVLQNDISLAAHPALGFEEVDRLIHFRKKTGVVQATVNSRILKKA